MKLTKLVFAALIILLGITHIASAFPICGFALNDLWFIGTGLAIVFSGLLNLLSARDCTRSPVSYLTFSVNFILVVLFIAARQVLASPLVYIGIYLYLASVLLYGIGFIRLGRKWQEYSKPMPTSNTEPGLLQGIEVIPMLRIFDKKKVEEFYVDWLGFTIEWEHRFEEKAPLYMEITRPGIKIHLTEHHGDCTPGGKVFIVCSGLREFHQHVLNKNYPYNRPGIEMASWGSLCMTVIDPFGNQLLFTEKK